MVVRIANLAANCEELPITRTDDPLPYRARRNSIRKGQKLGGFIHWTCVAPNCSVLSNFIFVILMKKAAPDDPSVLELNDAVRVIDSGFNQHVLNESIIAAALIGSSSNRP